MGNDLLNAHKKELLFLCRTQPTADARANTDPRRLPKPPRKDTPLPRRNEILLRRDWERRQAEKRAAQPATVATSKRWRSLDRVDAGEGTSGQAGKPPQEKGKATPGMPLKGAKKRRNGEGLFYVSVVFALLFIVQRARVQ